MNLKQIGLALRSYHEDHGRFPPAVIYSPEGRPLYSWRVLILPYLEQKDLYDKFDLNAPWDSPGNRELLAKRPWVYEPVGIATEPSLTFDQVFIGTGTAFEGPRGVTLDDFPDGPERTLLVVEAAEPVPWTKPIDLPYMAVAQLPQLGGVFKARSRPLDSGGVDGFNALFADGSVRFIHKKRITEPVLRALITRNGGERMNDSEF
jgi:prepilin-type processing-associated H-X9-DG protein